MEGRLFGRFLVVSFLEFWVSIVLLFLKLGVDFVGLLFVKGEGK